MDNPTSTPTNNIVAAAMSTANLSIAPDSPQLAVLPIQADTSPQSQHIPMVGSPSQHARSPATKMPSTESMDITEHQAPTHALIRQQSQDSDTQCQPSMEASQRTPSNQFRDEDSEKTVVVKSEGKEPHLVMVTPPSSFPPTTMNGGLQRVLLYNEREKHMMSSIPMNLHLPNKEPGVEPYARPKEDATYPITCGNNKADLVWKKFICPGINAKCVKCGDNWYTPKEFVNVAGKSTLKDWKRAIRINGTMLRKMIENGELNYYDHDNNCSNQCRSNKSSSFDNVNEKSFNSFESDSREMSREHSMDGGPVRSSSEELPSLQSKRVVGLPTSYNKSQELSSTSTLVASNSLERSSSEDSGHAASPHLDGMLMRETAVSVEKVQDLHSFWNGIIRMDLFDDIVRDVVTQITNLHSKTNHTGTISMEDVVTMTNLVNSLEMIPSIVHKMSLHKHSVEKQAEESNHTIQELEKRLAEQKKFEQDLKRKSQHLDNVMSLTPTEKRQKRNIIRIGRQKAVDSRIPPGVMPGTSSSPVSASIRDNVMLGAVAAAGGRIPQRELWPQTIQAASSQMARMNVSGTAQAMSAIPHQFALLPHPGMHTPPEAYQAFVTSQAAHHSSSRENTQSPKK